MHITYWFHFRGKRIQNIDAIAISALNLQLNLSKPPQVRRCPYLVPSRTAKCSVSDTLIYLFSFQVGESRNVTAADTLMDLARNLLPPNLIQASMTTIRRVK